MTTEYGMWIQGDCQILLALRTSQLLINTNTTFTQLWQKIVDTDICQILVALGPLEEIAAVDIQKILLEDLSSTLKTEHGYWIVGDCQMLVALGDPAGWNICSNTQRRYVVGSLQHNCQGLLPFRSPWQFCYNNLIVLIWLNSCCNFRAIESALFSTASVS